MPRTVLTKTKLVGGNSGEMLEVVFSAVDSVNGNAFFMNGGEIILVRNLTGASESITLRSSPDQLQRTGDRTHSIPAGDTVAYGPFNLLGWKQIDGYFYIDAEDTALEVGILSPQF